MLLVLPRGSLADTRGTGTTTKINLKYLFKVLNTATEAHDVTVSSSEALRSATILRRRGMLMIKLQPSLLYFVASSTPTAFLDSRV